MSARTTKMPKDSRTAHWVTSLRCSTLRNERGSFRSPIQTPSAQPTATSRRPSAVAARARASNRQKKRASNGQKKGPRKSLPNNPAGNSPNGTAQVTLPWKLLVSIPGAGRSGSRLDALGMANTSSLNVWHSKTCDGKKKGKSRLTSASLIARTNQLTLLASCTAALNPFASSNFILHSIRAALVGANNVRGSILPPRWAIVNGQISRDSRSLLLRMWKLLSPMERETEASEKPESSIISTGMGWWVGGTWDGTARQRGISACVATTMRTQAMSHSPFWPSRTGTGPPRHLRPSSSVSSQ